jgi:hypothetical protein
MHDKVNFQYKNSIYRSIVYDIDGLLIPFDSQWSKIGISVSGGADSALLAYLLCSLITEQHSNTEVYIISHVRMWKTRPWQRYNSIDVFNWLQNRFKNIKFTRHENFIPPDLEYGDQGATITDEYGNLKSGDQIIIRAHAEWICASEKLNAWYSAKSKNPSDNSVTKGMPDRFVSEPSIDKLLLNHREIYVSNPFLYTEKDWIVKQYIRNNILDLFNITRSCEGDFKDLNYANYVPDQFVPECGECFWCQERNWAWKKNNVR